MVSGRAGFEIVQKAIVAGIPALASVSAPSSLAVALARASGMVLLGFVRGHGMNVYAGESGVALGIGTSSDFIADSFAYQFRPASPHACVSFRQDQRDVFLPVLQLSKLSPLNLFVTPLWPFEWILLWD